MIICLVKKCAYTKSHDIIIHRGISDIRHRIAHDNQMLSLSPVKGSHVLLVFMLKHEKEKIA